MPDRTVAPPFVKSASFDLIQPEKFSLPNGVQVFVVAGGSQDVVKIEFVFEAGRWFEDKTAASYFTAQLLPKGTGEKNSFEIASIFDRYGSHLEISPGLDFVSVSVYALNKNLSPVLSLLMEILTVPSFPGKEFKQTKSVFIQNLKVNNEKTSYVASQLFRKNLFGGTHPYGVEVNEENVSSLSTGDFQKHFQSCHHAPMIFVSGKIDARQKDIMLKKFSEYTSGKNAAGKNHQRSGGPANQYLEKPESVQSSVRMGKRSVLRSHPDYVPILFVSHILGGYFGSRLMKNIREEKGLTYGISASIHGLKHESYLVIGADVNKENKDLTFAEIRKELNLLRTQKIPADELETTRNHFIGSLQAEITTPFAHAEKIKTIQLYNLSPVHYQEMIRRIDSLTGSDVASISEQYFQEDSFLQVAVG